MTYVARTAPDSRTRGSLIALSPTPPEGPLNAEGPVRQYTVNVYVIRVPRSENVYGRTPYVPIITYAYAVWATYLISVIISIQLLQYRLRARDGVV